jgi:hypothetical protein
MQLPQSHPKSAVIDMEPSATRLHLPGLSLEHRHQTFSTLFGNHDAELAHRPSGVGCILSGPRSSQALSDRKQLDAELLLNPLCKHKEIWRLVGVQSGQHGQTARNARWWIPKLCPLFLYAGVLPGIRVCCTFESSLRRA